ncbi:MAG TPA: hypothetical protein PKW76_01945 [bacterium]|nr:hypothetical protein [bacterium]HPG44419.1 hypothetical protein [bacterium]HPM96977.1 hypothetical protein [bacterium]
MKQMALPVLARAVVGFGLLLFACAEREMPLQNFTAGAPVLSDLSMPQIFNPNRYHPITVRVEHPAGPRAVHSVKCRVLRTADGVETMNFSLYDDGAAEQPQDGDVVAFDGIFSQQLFWDQSVDSEQLYRFVFQATDSDDLSSDPLEQTARTARRSAPILLAVTLPEMLPSGFAGQKLLTAAVADSNGIQDVQKVVVKGLLQEVQAFSWTLNDRGVLGDLTAGDGLFSLAVDRSAGAGLQGPYQLQVVAEDLSAAQSQIYETQMLIENHPPTISEAVAPDSVLRPAPGIFDVYLVTVKVDDPQTLADIQTVKFKWVKPDGSYASSGPYFEMFDNGLPYDLSRWGQGYRGDQLAGDGIFSTVVIFGARPEDEQPLLGNYTLTFQAEDKVGQLSNVLNAIIKLK